MQFREEADCIQMMLDLLCYERIGRRLSPEASWLLHGHLLVCSGCLCKANDFLEILAEPESYPDLAALRIKP